MSSRYLTDNGGFEVQVELKVLNTLLEWYTVSAKMLAIEFQFEEWREDQLSNQEFR